MKPADFLRLLSEEPSSFEHRTYDKFDFRGLAGFSQDIDQADERQLQTLGRSIVQDAFFALRGHAPIDGDPMAATWASITQQPDFARLREDFGQDLVSQAIATLSLSKFVEQALMTPTDADAPVPAHRLEQAESLDFAVPGEVVDQAAAEAEGLQSFVEAISASLDGAPPKIFDQALQLSKEFDLAAFADLMGFVSMSVGGASRVGQGGSEEMTGYSRGGLSDQILPWSLVQLARGDRATRMEMAEESLTLRQYRSKRPQGKGPVVLLRDRSGSMSVPHNRPPHKTALSFELAMADAFNKNNRDLVSIAWSDTPGAPYVYGTTGIEAHLTVAPSGGTAIIPALLAGVKAASEYVDGADILVETDASLSEIEVGRVDYIKDQLEAFRKSGGRVWVVVLGNIREDALARNLSWADGYCSVDALRPGQSLGGIIAKMATRPGEAKSPRIVD